MSTLDAVLARIDQDIDQSVERLFALLRIASISTDPAYKQQCRTAAEHVAADLKSIGFDAIVRPTEGHPVVVGKSNGVAGPHVLFYGHYDVQPVDPLSQWKTPPFEPRIETLPGGRKIIVARGACDDKGQAMTFIEACRAFKAVTGKLPLPITTMIEGEEECGSKNLFKFVRDNAAEFKLDLALVCDTAMWDQQTPAVTTSLRGLVYEDVKITCADRDLHSGVFGGAAQNPIRLLAKILGALWDDNGRVTIPGFYDGVKDLPADIKADLVALDLTPKKFLGPIGLKTPAGEKGYLLIEQITTRPTAEINGIVAGYTERAPRPSSPARPRPRCRSAWSASRTQPKSGTPSAPLSLSGCRRTVRSSSEISAWRRRCSFHSTIRRSTRRAPCWARSGARRRWRLAPAARSRSWPTSRACSAWIRCWSVSRSTTTACIRRMRSSTSNASIRASAPGRGFWPRWRKASAPVCSKSMNRNVLGCHLIVFVQRGPGCRLNIARSLSSPSSRWRQDRWPSRQLWRRSRWQERLPDAYSMDALSHPTAMTSVQGMPTAGRLTCGPSRDTG